MQVHNLEKKYARKHEDKKALTHGYDFAYAMYVRMC